MAKRSRMAARRSRRFSAKTIAAGDCIMNTGWVLAHHRRQSSSLGIRAYENLFLASCHVVAQVLIDVTDWLIVPKALGPDWKAPYPKIPP